MSAGSPAHHTVTQISPDHPPSAHHGQPLLLSSFAPAHTHTAEKRRGEARHSDTRNSIFISPCASCFSSLLKHSAGSLPLFLSFFSFYFCSLPWLPGKDSLCCLCSHLLLATVDICLFKLSLLFFWTLPHLSHFYTVPLSVFFFSLFLFLFSFL